MELTWVDTYYEALEFFYWEPQHFRVQTPATAEAEKLAKIAKRASRITQVRSHLRKMEVTLNHNLLQFFHLAPDNLRTRLFAEFFGRSFESAFEMHGRNFDEIFNIDAVQPDVLFTSETDVVSIEMKIGSKCTVEQILKYALLGLAVEIKRGKQPLRHYLILLGSGSLAAQFREKFATVIDLKAKVEGIDLVGFLRNKPADFRQLQERLTKIVHAIQVRFCSYSRLSDLLNSSAPPQADQSDGAQVYRKLISGLVKELELRKLDDRHC